MRNLRMSPKLNLIEIQDGRQNGRYWTKWEKSWGYKMKITLIEHNQLFPFHEESENVPETDFHENPRWPPR